jgi:cytochrome c556
MNIIFNHRTIIFAVIISFCGIFSAQAAESDHADMIKYRRSIMKSQREHMAAAMAIIQGKVDFKVQLADHVRAMEATTGVIAELFPAGTDSGDTLALGEVWSNRAEFNKRARETSEKAALLTKVVVAGDVSNYNLRATELLDSCKACHKLFRKKEEK